MQIWNRIDENLYYNLKIDQRTDQLSQLHSKLNTNALMNTFNWEWQTAPEYEVLTDCTKPAKADLTLIHHYVQIQPCEKCTVIVCEPESFRTESLKCKNKLSALSVTVERIMTQFSPKFKTDRQTDRQSQWWSLGKKSLCACVSCWFHLEWPPTTGQL